METLLAFISFRKKKGKHQCVKVVNVYIDDSAAFSKYSRNANYQCQQQPITLQSMHETYTGTLTYSQHYVKQMCAMQVFKPIKKKKRSTSLLDAFEMTRKQGSGTY